MNTVDPDLVTETITEAEPTTDRRVSPPRDRPGPMESTIQKRQDSDQVERSSSKGGLSWPFFS